MTNRLNEITSAGSSPQPKKLLKDFTLKPLWAKYIFGLSDCHEMSHIENFNVVILMKLHAEYIMHELQIMYRKLAFQPMGWDLTYWNLYSSQINLK